MSNPFLTQDINNVIDAFSSPVDAGEQTPGQQTFQAIAGLPSWLKNQDWGAGSYAMWSDGLQKRIDEAQGAVDSLYSYGTQATKTGTVVDANIAGINVQGIEIQNTFYTMANADNVGNALKTLIADCIPCVDRISMSLSLNPLDGAWDILERNYQQMVSFILGLYDLLLGDKSVGVFSDFCSLLKFLNFMCLPDLYRIVIVLMSLVTKYSFKLQDIKLSFTAILGKIMGPALTPLTTMIDKYIQLILAPIECVIASLDAQLQSLDVVQAFKQGAGDQNAERTFDLSAIAGPLSALKKYMDDSVSEIKTEFEKLEKNINDFLDIQSLLDQQLFDYTFHIETVMKLIGLVQAVIMAYAQGVIVCGPNSETSEEALQGFVNTYVAPQFNISITVSDGQATIRPTPPKDIEGLLSVLGTYKKESEKKDLPRLDTLPAAAEPLPLGQISVPVKSCLYTVTDHELDRVKDFLGSFQRSGT